MRACLVPCPRVSLLMSNSVPAEPTALCPAVRLRGKNISVQFDPQDRAWLQSVVEADMAEPIEDLSARWSAFDGYSTFGPFAMRMLGFAPDAAMPGDAGVIDRVWKGALVPVLTLYRVAELKGWLNSAGGLVGMDVGNLGTEIGRIANLIAMAGESVMCQHRATRLSNNDGNVNMGAYFDKFQFSCLMQQSLDDKVQSPYQVMLDFLLLRAQRLGYRRSETDCYRQIYHNGTATHAWEPAESIEEFVYNSISRHTMYEQWLAATSAGAHVPNAVQYLTLCQDQAFPTLRPNRYIYAFTNGLYDAQNDTFQRFDGEVIDTAIVATRFIAVELSEHDAQAGASRGTLSQDAHAGDWRDISTPDIDSIFKHQGFDDATIDWTYALLGRCLFPVNHLDKWQICPFLIGVAGCGKSTVCSLLKHFFHPRRVSTISSNTEGRFGLAGIWDSDVCISTEVTKSWPLDRGVWQSCVTGERVCVPVKFKSPKEIDWDVPMFMAGNEPPDWEDKSRSVFRRMVCLYMRNRVRDADPGLQQRLKDAAPAHLVKFVRAYHEMCRRHRDKDVWSPGVFPDQIHRFHLKMLGDVDMLSRFIKEHCEVRPDLYCPEKVVRERFFEYRKAITDGASKRTVWNEDMWGSTFEDFAITVSVPAAREYPINSGRSVQGAFCIGMDVTQEDGFAGGNASGYNAGPGPAADALAQDALLNGIGALGT